MRLIFVFMAVLLSTTVAATPLVVINTVPFADGQSAPLLDLYLDGFPLATRVRYAEVVSLANAPMGTRNFSVRTASGRVIAERALNLSPTAPRGHFLAFAGDGGRQPYALITWQRAPVVAPGSPTNARSRTETIHLSPALDERVSVGGAGVTGSLPYGERQGSSNSASSPAPVVFELAVIDSTHGLLKLRLPGLAAGEHYLTNFLIGNGAQQTPIEWLSYDDTTLLARGLGSYVENPALASPRYFAFVGQVGRGLFLDVFDGGQRLVGFVTGMAADNGTSWQLLDGQRTGARLYRLVAITPAPTGTVGEEWRLRFTSCNDVELERYDFDRLVETAMLRRGETVESCVEFASREQRLTPP